MIKHWPIALKIWGVFAAITLCIFMMLAMLLPWTLKGFFTEQLYDIILDSQNSVTAMESIQVTASGEGVVTSTQAAPAVPALPVQKVIRVSDETMPVPFELAGSVNLLQSSQTISLSPMKTLPPDGPGVNHIVILNKDGNTLETRQEIMAALPQPFALAIEAEAGRQQASVQKYSLDIGNKTMFYVIRKDATEGKSGYVVSYAWGKYRNDLVLTMFWRLMLLMVLLFVVSWAPCLWFARYLSRPLIQMEKQAGRIAERDWHEPFNLDRKDEMGRLGLAFEGMRKRLVRQDKAQQYFLQNISHELKTPVMVIRSYAQSILDGVFPKKTLQASLETIMHEAERLEKRIRDLLYLNKLSYLSTRNKPFETFDLSEVLQDCVERLRYQRPELVWTVELPERWEILGEPKQWSVAFENILDNQMRYARGRIAVTAVMQGDTAKQAVRIWNDGPPVEASLQEKLFEPFQTGEKGQYGLGLAIVQQIMAYHQARIDVRNEDGGVAYILEPSASAGQEAERAREVAGGGT
ncbi:HAMP domain-containing sensor histidine kinase [Paenibacillus rigui]|uniref:histidine kinase n=1 Tax=Paenibacillus rigui TaxID=554312 RepID=A0A229UPJ5_9BACL|nr:HAMP domain-containing sensor histidine kinase [Paenibacillus rigui]OXM85135.1 two-component sensor histidine kinase [Paenibacillus rigui]